MKPCITHFDFIIYFELSLSAILVMRPPVNFGLKLQQLTMINSFMMEAAII